MANMSPMNKLRRWSLREAQSHGQILAVTCNRCSITHRYLREDLIRLRGDMDLARLLRRFKCEEHGDRSMWLNVEDPNAAQRQTLQIRRLAEIQLKRIPVWRDEAPPKLSREDPRPGKPIIDDTVKKLSEFKGERLVLSCSCGRKGSYNVARQIESFGDITIRSFIAMKKSTCAESARGKCGGGCDQLVAMFNDYSGGFRS